MKRTEKESAVSPVVGVMLMLVVTIIIAAVVAAFAGGLSGSAEKAPSTILDVHIYSAKEQQMSTAFPGQITPDLTIDVLGGEPVNTKDLKLIFKWHSANKGKSFSSSYVFDAADSIDIANSYGPYNYNTPLYANDNTNGADSAKWGNVTLTTGTHIQTWGNYMEMMDGSYNPLTHTGSPLMDKLFAAGDVKDEAGYSAASAGGDNVYSGGVMDGFLSKGDFVTVTVLHIPSNQIIFDKEVMVQ